MSSRERILDAAAAVMLERGIARATTKEIARTAGCSEPLLYRYFPDKQALFMDVLTERTAPLTGWDQLADQHTVAANLTSIVEALLAFYRQSFPMAASLFGDRQATTTSRTTAPPASRSGSSGPSPSPPTHRPQPTRSNRDLPGLQPPLSGPRG